MSASFAAYPGTSSISGHSTGYDAFSARFGELLPTDFHHVARGMDWAHFCSAFSPNAPLTLDSFFADRAAGGNVALVARISDHGVQRTITAAAPGQISAGTALLYGLGRPVEIRSFHQFSVPNAVASALYCEGEDGHGSWAFALGNQGDESAVRALIAAANILY